MGSSLGDTVRKVRNKTIIFSLVGIGKDKERVVLYVVRKVGRSFDWK